MLQADLAAVLEERLEVLEVRVSMMSESVAPFFSISPTSAKAPRRLAMSPDSSGSPSKVVTMPQ